MLTRRQRDQLQRRKHRIAASALAVTLAAGLGGAAYASGIIPGGKESASKIGRDYTPAVPNVAGNNSIGIRPPVELSSGRSKAESHPRAAAKKVSAKIVHSAVGPTSPIASSTEIAARPKTVSPARDRQTSSNARANRHAIETTQNAAPQADPFDEPKIPNNPGETTAMQQALQIWIQQEQAAHPNGVNNPENTYPSGPQKPSYCDLPGGFGDPKCQ